MDAVTPVACGCGKALILHYTVKEFQAVNVHQLEIGVAPVKSQRDLNILGAHSVGRLLFLLAVQGGFPEGPNHRSVAALIILHMGRSPDDLPCCIAAQLHEIRPGLFPSGLLL